MIDILASTTGTAEGFPAWLLYPLIAVGLVGCATFLALHRPRRWLSWASADATGWVVVALALLLRSLILLITNEGPHYDSLSAALVSQLSLVLIDVLIMVRLIAFIIYARRNPRGRGFIGGDGESPTGGRDNE